MAHHWSSGIVAKRQAWHGLARVRPAGFSFTDADVVAETDYTVDKFPLSVCIGDDLLLTGRYALGTWCLPADGQAHTYGIVTDRYHILQPADVRKYAQKLCDMSGATPETCIVLRKGLDYIACINIGSIAVPEPMQAFAMINSCYTGTNSVAVSASLVATVCANTQAAALREHCIRIPHTSIMHGELDSAIETIADAMDTARRYGDSMLPLVQARLSGLELHRAVRIAATAATDTYTLPEDPHMRILAERKLSRFIARLWDAVSGPQGRTEEREGTAYGILQAAYDAVEYTGRRNTNSLGRTLDGTVGDTQERIINAIREVYQ